MEPNNIHYKLFRIRRHLELSQENVAFELGISPEAYGKMERGKTKISVERLSAICKIFGLAPWQVIKLSADELIIHLINTPPVKDALTQGSVERMPVHTSLQPPARKVHRANWFLGHSWHSTNQQQKTPNRLFTKQLGV